MDRTGIGQDPSIRVENGWVRTRQERDRKWRGHDKVRIGKYLPKLVSQNETGLALYRYRF